MAIQWREVVVEESDAEAFERAVRHFAECEPVGPYTLGRIRYVLRAKKLSSFCLENVPGVVFIGPVHWPREA